MLNYFQFHPSIQQHVIFDAEYIIVLVSLSYRFDVTLAMVKLHDKIDSCDQTVNFSMNSYPERLLRTFSLCFNKFLARNTACGQRLILTNFVQHTLIDYLIIYSTPIR